MTEPQLKDQILKAIFRRFERFPNKNISIMEVKIEFDPIDNDSFYAAVYELFKNNLLLHRINDYVTITPEGQDRVSVLSNPPPTANQNTLTIGQAVNSPIQQGIHSHQTQTTNYELPSNEDLGQLVELMTTHLSELQLTPTDTLKVRAQLETIRAQLLDAPNPTIVREAGRTLKNITEGAIGSLIATAAQPGIWAVVQAILAWF